MEILLSILTGIGGVVAAYIRTISKDIRSVNDSVKDLTHEVKMSVQELRMDLDHTNERVNEVKIKLEKGEAHVRNQRNSRAN
jgi:hypothetical protein